MFDLVELSSAFLSLTNSCAKSGNASGEASMSVRSSSKDDASSPGPYSRIERASDGCLFILSAAPAILAASPAAWLKRYGLSAVSRERTAESIGTISRAARPIS